MSQTTDKTPTVISIVGGAIDRDTGTYMIAIKLEETTIMLHTQDARKMASNLWELANFGTVIEATLVTLRKAGMPDEVIDAILAGIIQNMFAGATVTKPQAIPGMLTKTA